MGYVAVRGGTQAIEESINRLKYERLKKGLVLDCHEIESGMRCLIDQVMSESSLYSETLAAISIKQAEGSPEEAVFLLRAYRSTLPRKHYSRTVHSEDMLVDRRISASFKEIPGGQILGAAYDYTHRLIDFDLIEETNEDAMNWVREFDKEREFDGEMIDLGNLPKVLDYLREEGLIPACADDDREPDDVTKESVQFPTSRSERLQILTSGQTGAVTSLGYAALRSFGALHPNVGELRIGNLPVYVDNPFNKQNEKENININISKNESENENENENENVNEGESYDENKDDRKDKDAYYIGEIKVTEVETLFPTSAQKRNGQRVIEFGLGYGICYGQNETKAIAMSILDRCLEIGGTEHPTHNEEFVLLHIDSVESTGFISHLKLPHYVTFQSELDSVRKSRMEGS